MEKELKKATNVTVMNDVRVEEYKLPSSSGEYVQLRLADGSTITCNLLVSNSNSYLFAPVVQRVYFDHLCT